MLIHRKSRESQSSILATKNRCSSLLEAAIHFAYLNQIVDVAAAAAVIVATFGVPLVGSSAAVGFVAVVVVQEVVASPGSDSLAAFALVAAGLGVAVTKCVASLGFDDSANSMGAAGGSA